MALRRRSTKDEEDIHKSQFQTLNNNHAQQRGSTRLVSTTEDE